MPYNEKLAERVSTFFQIRKGISSKKMFGGLCFLLNGHTLCGVVGKKLMARVGADVYERAVKQKFARPMDFTGRPLRGMVYVLPEGVRTKASLERWLNKSMSFVSTLPKKKK